MTALPPAARSLARLAVGWTALSELVPLYPLYALLFLDTGLSATDVSLLFAAWSLTAVLTEVPAGALADRWSRRGVLVVAGVLEAAAFAVWTVAPSFWGFAAGFAVWGVAGALVSGTVEALVYDGLADVGAESAFARVNGAMTAAELLVQVPTAAAAGLLYALGGYPLGDAAAYNIGSQFVIQLTAVGIAIVWSPPMTTRRPPPLVRSAAPA